MVAATVVADLEGDAFRALDERVFLEVINNSLRLIPSVNVADDPS